MGKYKSGCMPKTDFKYEEFEGLLGSFHLTLIPLKHSTNFKDKKDYQKAMNVLNRFAEKYKIQSPENAVKNPRAKEKWGNASVFRTTRALHDRMISFIVDFNIGCEPLTEDQELRYKLGRTILRILDRYDVAKINYQEYQGKQIPVGLEEWDEDKSGKSLVEVLTK